MQNLTQTFSKPEFQAELLHLLPYIIVGQLVYIIIRLTSEYLSCKSSKDQSKEFDLLKTLTNSLKIAITITILLSIATIAALLKKYN